MRRKADERLKPFSPEDLDNRFVYHAPHAAHRFLHDEIRDLIKCFAESLCDHVPDSREKALMVTKLEEVSFWAHAAVARQEL